MTATRIQVIVALFVVTFLCGLDTPLPAQTDISEADLIAASSGHTMRIGSTADGHITVVPLEVYVARVLAGEGDPRAADAAQQALAIAIRTYTLKNADRHARDGYDLCDSTHCQVPRPSTPNSRRATMATVGQVLMYEGQLASVFYSADCGGRTERAGDVWPGADYPYLVSRKDDACDEDPEWTYEVPVRDVQRALTRAGFEGERLKDVRVDGHTSSGRVAKLRLSGMVPEVIAGDQFRQALGATVLKSTAFELTRHGDTLRMVGKGYGHGVGMCVIGAGKRALRGETAREILAMYYPGLSLTPVGPESALVTRESKPEPRSRILAEIRTRPSSRPLARQVSPPSYRKPRRSPPPISSAWWHAHTRRSRRRSAHR